MKIRDRKIRTGLAIALAILAIASLSFLISKPMRSKKAGSIIRPAAFAGQFYPAKEAELSAAVRGYLAGAKAEEGVLDYKVIIVPHAGYDYSGPVMAAAYRQLEGRPVKRVYIIANSHRDSFSGIMTDDSDYWETPLGLVRVDKERARALASASSVVQIDRDSGKDDHTIEVQLPFLQAVLGTDFKIVPLLFGNIDEASYQALADLLAADLEPGDLVIASSDMSHYPPAELAKKIDAETLRLILEKDIAGLIKHSQDSLAKEAGEETVLCGLEAVKTALALAKQLRLEAQVLKYQNSGETVFGDKETVVGYGAVVFYDPAVPASQARLEPLGTADQAILKEVAREAVESYVRQAKVPDYEISSPRLNQIQGAFVTLKVKGELRGCIGEIIASEPLWQVVRGMAIAAATEDGRFQPVAKDELDELEYEISVLSVPERISRWQDISLGEDGIIIKKGLKSGVFLPQVALETGWDREELWRQLCSQKAGLDKDCYLDPQAELSVFQAQVF